MTTNTSSRREAIPAERPARSNMKAIVQHAYGAPQQVLELADVDKPDIGGDDVLIRVRATSVNTPDWIAVTGMPRILRLKTGLRRPATAVRGSDLAGVVEAVGRNVADLRPGDEVFGCLWDNQPVQRAGTFAEFTAAPAAQVVTKPTGVSIVEAAASVMTGITALLAMRDVGKVGTGTRVLVNGASGGVGTMAVQIAKAHGADVTGVCSKRNVALVRSLGADHVIDYTTADFTNGDRRYDVILDNVMNHPLSETARMLTPTGVLIPNSVGTSKGFFGGVPRAARAALMARRDAPLVRFVTCVVNRDNLTALAGLLESGTVKVMIDQVYQLDEAARAVAHVATHHARGKVVISVETQTR